MAWLGPFDAGDSAGWATAIADARARWQRLVDTGGLTCGTADRYLRAFQGFTRYAVAHGVVRFDGVSPEIGRRYIYASVSANERPSASTSRLRLAAVRDAYRGLIEAGLCGVDPTAGLTVERHLGVRALDPLTPLEVDRLRNASRLRPSDKLRPAMVAAALLGASHSEIAGLVVDDLDVGGASLRLGRATSATRLVALDKLSLQSLRARMSALRRLHRRSSCGCYPDVVALALHKPAPAYRPQSVAPTVSMNLSRALEAAGSDDPGCDHGRYGSSPRTRSMPTPAGLRMSPGSWACDPWTPRCVWWIGRGRSGGVR